MNLMRALLGTYRWMKPALIPNRQSYKFSAQLNDGSFIDCETVYDQHRVDRPGVISVEKADLKFEDIYVWREL